MSWAELLWTSLSKYIWNHPHDVSFPRAASLTISYFPQGKVLRAREDPAARYRGWTWLAWEELGTAAGRGEWPTRPTASAGSEPLMGAADWDLAGLDLALSWPRYRAGGLWVGEGGVKGWDLTQPRNPSTSLLQPPKWDFSWGGSRPLPQTSCVPEEKSEGADIWGRKCEIQRLKVS